MTSMEDSMKMQAIAILLATNDCPRVIKKRLYDELLNLAKIKLPQDELKEYEEAFKPGHQNAFLRGYLDNFYVEPPSPSPPIPIQARPTPTPSTIAELAFHLANDMNFRYAATKRSKQEFAEIIENAKRMVEEQDKTGEPRGF